ncbi:MAG: beta-N-acetylhexosaminidase [Solirubrobacteraceae bacterium]|jgi:beta-N-acetylhexosaminidase|nr:beta-N-acetylhexosaminidase [Solirubrobacteraceae bacterium]
MRRGPSRRLVGVAVVAAALAGVLLALIQGPSRHRALPQGGSRFGTPSTVHPGETLMDALAPVLAADPGQAVGARALATVARGLGQLFVIGIDGTSVTTTTLERLHAHDWGGVVLGRPNYAAPGQLTGLTAAIRAALTTPPLIVARQAGGRSNGFPGLPPQGEPDLGATGRTDLVTAQSGLAARRLRVLGVNATLAPIADLAINGGPAEDRGFGTDATVVANLVRAAVSGYRSGKLISMVGHFPGEGAANQDPTQGAATVGGRLTDLMGRDVKPFAAAAATAPVVQLSDAVYAAFDGVTPATLLADAVTVLRDRLGFGGVVMSGDLLAVTAATGGSAADAAVAALKAGCDLLFLPGGATDAEAAYNAVLAAIRQGQLDPQAVARSLGRVAGLKKAYGIG